MINAETRKFFQDEYLEGKHKDILDNEPLLFQDMLVYWQAFWDLNADRQTGFSIGYIPTTPIRDHFKDLGYGPEARIDAFRYIRAMDIVYVEFYKDKEENDPPKD